MTEEYLRYGHRLEPHIADTSRLCWEALDAGETVLFEGAQAALLDLDHGTYPFVTSSNPVAGAACVGAGVGPDRHRRGLGRLQGLHDPRRRGPVPDRAHRRGRRRTCAIEGHEFGTTTGRERRCGWLDLVALRYATRLNRLAALAITKLDVLSGLDPLRIAVRYRGTEGAVFDEFPYHQSILHRRRPSTRRCPGWERRHHRRPQRGRPAARGARLPAAISEGAGVPIALVGVGPGREQVIRTGAGRAQGRLTARGRPAPGP